MADGIIPQRTPHVKGELSSTLESLLEFTLNLCKERGYCWAQNAHFAEKTDCTDRTISTRFKILEDEGYIVVYYVYGERHIRPGKPYPFYRFSTQKTENCVHTKETKGTKEKNTTVKQTEQSLESAVCVEGKEECHADGSRESGNLAKSQQSRRSGVEGTPARQDGIAAGMEGLEDEGAGRESPPEYQRRGFDRVQPGNGNAGLSTDTQTASPIAPGSAQERVTAGKRETEGGGDLLREERDGVTPHHDRAGWGRDMEAVHILPVTEPRRQRPRVEAIANDSIPQDSALRENGELHVMARNGTSHSTESAPSPELDSLIAEGVETRTATAIAATHSRETLERYIRAYQVKKAAGKAGGVGWLISAILNSWSVKTPNATPAQITAKAVMAREAGFVVKQLPALEVMPDWDRKHEESKGLRGMVAQSRQALKSEGMGVSAI